MSSRRGVQLPTDTSDWQLIFRTARLVVSLPVYAALAFVGSLLGLSVFVLSQNIQFVQDVVVGGGLPLEARIAVLVGLYPVVGSAFTPVTSGFLLLTAGLFGINAAMLTYHIREHRLGLREGSGSIAGVFLGTLGAGCAACGSAILAGVLSLFGATGLLTVLPLDGLEFSILAFGALLLSIYWLADGMRGGEVAGCPVEIG
ncbi:hypothetical protein [Haloarcula nitratireducens]|uniref:Uncharacterized protein n=1 Tax=Haloarcula nitratireducens TaxID=2487749 RepID=A0AAW4PK23_9EURY|nr:hypothetical protein [Halomicroarcula nitratireducens]MBX0298087.1 hypothetical protein [Halomicroarcula nitratireducens]